MADGSLFTEDDLNYLGYQGFDVEENPFVYRACNVHDSNSDIGPADPNSTCSVEDHVHSAARNPSRFISATTDLKIAINWAYKELDTKEKEKRGTPRQVIKIDMKKIQQIQQENDFINLTNRRVLEHFVHPQKYRDFAVNAKEVLFVDRIPANTYEVLSGIEDPYKSIDGASQENEVGGNEHPTFIFI